MINVYVPQSCIGLSFVVYEIDSLDYSQFNDMILLRNDGGRQIALSLAENPHQWACRYLGLNETPLFFGDALHKKFKPTMFAQCMRLLPDVPLPKLI